VLLVLGGLITTFLIGYVVPKFAVVYQESDSEVPRASAKLINISKLIGVHPEVLITGLRLLTAMIVAAFVKSQVRSRISQMIRGIPASARVSAFLKWRGCTARCPCPCAAARRWCPPSNWPRVC
jgi:general secretion pathway protein F